MNFNIYVKTFKIINLIIIINGFIKVIPYHANSNTPLKSELVFVEEIQ